MKYENTVLQSFLGLVYLSSVVGKNCLNFYDCYNMHQSAGAHRIFKSPFYNATKEGMVLGNPKRYFCNFTYIITTYMAKLAKLGCLSLFYESNQQFRIMRQYRLRVYMYKQDSGSRKMVSWFFFSVIVSAFASTTNKFQILFYICDI